MAMVETVLGFKLRRGGYSEVGEYDNQSINQSIEFVESAPLV